MFLVVTLHSALAYTRFDVPRLLWGVRDRSPGLAFDIFGWWAMGVSLPLFFLIAGFFTAEIDRTRGLAGLVRNRAVRIGGPFLAAGLTVLPLTFLAWTAGWLMTGRCTLREIRRMKFHAQGLQEGLFGPAHLWFLEYLLVLLAVYAAARWLRVAPTGDGDGRADGFDRVLGSSWRVPALALPTALVLWVGRERVGVDAILDRHNSFLIDPVRLLYHGLFFAVGARLNRVRAELSDRFGPTGLAYLGLAALVFLPRAVLLDRDHWHHLGGAWAWALVGSGALFAWLTVFGLLGLALRSFDRPSPAVRYLADASYWVYLVHLPVVGLLQADLFGAPLPTWAKFLTTQSVTLAVCLASYQVLVRTTVLGRWLHGSRVLAASSPAAPESSTGRLAEPGHARSA